MSMLPPEVSAELTQLLQALQSPDNSIRSQAEDHLQTNWTATTPEILLMGLAEQIAGAPESSVILSTPPLSHPAIPPSQISLSLPPIVVRRRLVPLLSETDSDLPGCLAD